ncbi:MAG TPA: hypothetical protein VKY85_27540 [Candidatus Angelobacter sp.]|nr:hypothetical protein [Candidatus Angelobacter sp.]
MAYDDCKGTRAPPVAWILQIAPTGRARFQALVVSGESHFAQLKNKARLTNPIRLQHQKI